MGRFPLFVIGLILLGATLLELGLLFFRIFPPNNRNTISIQSEDLPSLTPAETLPAVNGFVPGSTIQHVVQADEDLRQIARCYGVTFQEARTANPQIVDPVRLEPGMWVIIPHIGSVGKIYGPPCVVLYTIQAGDTWTSIAQRFNADFAVLQLVNNNSPLTVGAILKIPLNSAGAPVSICPQAVRLNIPAGQTVVTHSGTFHSALPLCFEFGAGRSQAPLASSGSSHNSLLMFAAGQDEPGLSVSVTSPDDSLMMAILASDENVIKPAYDPDLLWTGTAGQTEGSNVVISSNKDNTLISYTLELRAVQSVVVPPATATPVPLPALVIEAEWPKRLEVDVNGHLRISLIHINDDTFTPVVEITGNTASASTAIPQGTPGVDPEKAFGDDYEASVIPSLHATTIQYDPPQSVPQSLAEPRTDWIWSISSNNEGRQSMAVTIDVEWRRKDGSDGPIQHTIWRPAPLEIEVFQPRVTIGQLSILPLVSGSIGSALVFPFWYGVLKERRTKTQQKPKRKAQRR